MREHLRSQVKLGDWGEADYQKGYKFLGAKMQEGIFGVVLKKDGSIDGYEDAISLSGPEKNILKNEIVEQYAQLFSDRKKEVAEIQVELVVPEEDAERQW